MFSIGAGTASTSRPRSGCPFGSGAARASAVRTTRRTAVQETITDDRSVACLGEALVLVSLADSASAADTEGHLAGAEANVAAGLVAWGVPAAWIGRLGDDEFGALVRTELSARGVDISAV